MTKSILAAALFALASSGVIAQGTTPAAAPAHGAPTRAEVLADLQIYIESGLRNLDFPEGVDHGSPAYLAAKQRYEDLRKSPRYAELVRSQANRLGERMAVAGSAAPGANGSH